MVKDGALSLKIDFISILLEILNLERHLNCFIGLKVRAILVNGEILPSVGVALGRVWVCSFRSRLVYYSSNRSDSIDISDSTDSKDRYDRKCL